MRQTDTWQGRDVLVFVGADNLSGLDSVPQPPSLPLYVSQPSPAALSKAVELSRVKDEKSLDFFFREVEVMRVR